MAFVPEGRCDRSLARSAWESTTQRDRPVGYGMIRAGLRTDSMIGAKKFFIRGTHLRREIPLGLAAPDHTAPFGTVSLGGRFPRHFVPGLRSCCPSGTSFFKEPFESAPYLRRGPEGLGCRNTHTGFRPWDDRPKRRALSRHDRSNILTKWKLGQLSDRSTS